MQIDKDVSLVCSDKSVTYSLTSILEPHVRRLHFNDFSQGLNDELANELIDNPGRVIVLVSYEPTEIENWIWQDIRSKEQVLNPLVACGSISEKKYIKDKPYFVEGAAKYQCYMSVPWSLEKLKQAIASVEPLYDEFYREYFYNKYGHSSILGRILDTLHGVKCLSPNDEMVFLQSCLTNAKALDDVSLIKQFEDLVNNFKVNDLNSAKQVKDSIEEYLRYKDEVQHE